MSWVDVADDVGNIVKDGASIPGNRVAGEAEYVKARAGQVMEPVSNAIDDFQTKGNQEGYAEAIWQDVVQPIAGSPTSRGAIVGGAGALGIDLLDPTPGINPMNIAGGVGAGAAVGTALPYAYDAVQAMSSPNSLLRGSTYSKALEGAGIATGITGDTRHNTGDPLIDRGSNIATNVAEGLGNAYQGALAGTNQLGSDVAGFFGFDGVEEMYQVLADDRRKAQTPNSAMGAMAQELSYDAGMGGALGKGAEVIGAGGKVISKWANKNVIDRGRSAIDDLLTIAKDTVKDVKVPTKVDDFTEITDSATKNLLKNRRANKQNITDDLFNKAKKDTSMFPGAQALADLAGTFSPKSKKFIEDVWDTGAAYIFGGKNASLRAYDKMANEAKKAGFSDKEASEILKWMSDNPKYFEPLKDAVTSGTNTNTAKLLGVGTAITADVED